MAKPGQAKYPYSVRVLSERLDQEKSNLVEYNKHIIFDKMPWGKESGETNKKSCEHRIAELEEVIENLTLVTFTQEECENQKEE